MTEDRLALTELLEKAGEGDFLRAVAEAVLQLLMEADVEGLIGPGATSAAVSGAPGAMATATAPSTPGSARCNCGSQNCGRAAISRRFLKLARVRRRRWSR